MQILPLTAQAHLLGVCSELQVITDGDNYMHRIFWNHVRSQNELVQLLLDDFVSPCQLIHIIVHCLALKPTSKILH